MRGWTHLERQRGGIGLRVRVKQLSVNNTSLSVIKLKNHDGRITKIRKQREQGRRARKRATIPTVALVGYTNAGKSTYLNRLTVRMFTRLTIVLRH